MTAEQLANITQRQHQDVSAWLQPLRETFDRYAINTRQRREMFVAQVAMESNGFRNVEENLRYTSGRLLQVFPRHFTAANVQQYAGQPQRIANRVYANRMGNGNEASGDGWRFRGRGLKQLTGRWNYEQCGKGLEIDLIENPDLLLQPRFAALSAGWFWSRNNLSRLADTGDFTAVTRRINGGLNGLRDREIYYQRVKRQGI